MVPKRRNADAFSQNSNGNTQWLVLIALQGAQHGLKALPTDIGMQRSVANTRCIGLVESEKVGVLMNMHMNLHRAVKFGLIAVVGVALSGCSSIRESRGYVVDNVLLQSIQPGIDNQRSVEGTLGRPTFTSQFGEATWYYVSSVTGRKPFVRPSIQSHAVIAIQFDEAGNVASTERSGVDQIVRLRPDGDKTPTLGRERGFFEDLFGNIGQVGAPGAGGGA